MKAVKATELANEMLHGSCGEIKITTKNVHRDASVRHTVNSLSV